MPCILCSPEECDILAARINALDVRLVHGAAKLAQFDGYSMPRMSADLYRENHRAFVSRYEGRHMEGVQAPTTHFDVRDLPVLSDAADLGKLESSLAFFAYQCSEGDCYASPMYRFIKALHGRVCDKILDCQRGDKGRSSWAIVGTPAPKASAAPLQPYTCVFLNGNTPTVNASDIADATAQLVRLAANQKTTADLSTLRLAETLPAVLMSKPVNTKEGYRTEIKTEEKEAAKHSAKRTFTRTGRTTMTEIKPTAKHINARVVDEFGALETPEGATVDANGVGFAW
jgi:hypothetical protein